MTFDGDINYLRRVFTKAETSGENFYKDRLYYVFFYGLSNLTEMSAQNCLYLATFGAKP